MKQLLTAMCSPHLNALQHDESRFLKNLNSKLLILFVGSLLFIGCQKEASTGSSFGESTLTAKNTSEAAAQSKSVTFTMDMDFSTNSAFGTFTATGAINTSSAVEFNYNPNGNFITAHNVITLTTNEGTIVMHDACEFAVDKAFPSGRGSWHIVSGSGAYANIGGNGAESFPTPTEDILTGIIH